MDDPNITPRDVLPAATIMYMRPGGHRQWPHWHQGYA